MNTFDQIFDEKIAAAKAKYDIAREAAREEYESKSAESYNHDACVEYYAKLDNLKDEYYAAIESARIEYDAAVKR